eukprot:1190064-Prorocentrum_minimum.AAC.3
MRNPVGLCECAESAGGLQRSRLWRAPFPQLSVERPDVGILSNGSLGLAPTSALAWLDIEMLRCLKWASYCMMIAVWTGAGFPSISDCTAWSLPLIFILGAIGLCAGGHRGTQGTRRSTVPRRINTTPCYKTLQKATTQGGCGMGSRLLVHALGFLLYVSADAYQPDLLLESSPTTTHWGEWAWNVAPAARVHSGAVVRARCYTAVNWWEKHEVAGFEVPEPMKAIHAAGCVPPFEETRFPCGKLGPHLMTGPVYVEGAEVGDVLQVDILDVEVITPWGWNMVRPGAGSLKHFEGGYHTYGLDLEQQRVNLPWGGHVPFNVTGTSPFFGQLGTAPPKELGPVSSVQPGAEFGGNIDNKHLGRGTTLYLPVNVEGGLFSAGDGHAVQGDGEVCVTAMETSLRGDFRLTVRKDLGVAGRANGTSWVPPGKTRLTQVRSIHKLTHSSSFLWLLKLHERHSP